MEFEVDFTVAQPSCEATFEITAGDKYFYYEQSAPSKTWNITHNLGKKPVVTIVDSADTVIQPDEIKYYSRDSLVVKFLVEFAGKAYLN